MKLFQTGSRKTGTDHENMFFFWQLVRSLKDALEVAKTLLCIIQLFLCFTVAITLGPLLDLEVDVGSDLQLDVLLLPVLSLHVLLDHPEHTDECY